MLRITGQRSQESQSPAPLGPEALGLNIFKDFLRIAWVFFSFFLNFIEFRLPFFEISLNF